MRAIMVSVVLILGVGAALYLALTSETAASDVGATLTSGPADDVSVPAHVAVEDAELDPFRDRLLETAFEAVSAMPLNPHAKNRSRGQERVIAAAFELEQPHRALRYVDRIADWRRGAGHGDYAFYLARKGVRGAVIERHLEIALAEADALAASEESQAWRRDRIRSKIAKTRVVLGDFDEVAAFRTTADPSQIAEVDAMMAARVEPAAFETTLKQIDEVIASADLDQVRSALEMAAELFDRFYTDAEKRAAAEERVVTGYAKLPLGIRIGLMMKLASSALDHDGGDHAAELAREARRQMDGFTWLPKHEIPVSARLAVLEHRAGAEVDAATHLVAALALYDEKRMTIVDVFRAGVLRPLAEAFAEVGDDETARRTYARALDEGAVNPNSRPRADDLADTCTSMALHEIEPDASMWSRIEAITKNLGEPW